MNSIGNWINAQVINSVARWAVTGGVGFAAGKGWVSPTEATGLIAAILGLVTVVAGILSARMSNSALKIVGDGSVTDGKAVVKTAIKDQGI